MTSSDNQQPIDWQQLTESLQSQVRDKLGGLASPRWATTVRVVFNPRLKSTAGRALPGAALIELNPRLVPIGDEHLLETLWHEAAHLLARKRHPIRRIQPHGAEWQQACTDLGIPGAAATHRLPLPRTRQRPKFLYRCPECGYEIQRVRRIRAEAACHRCCTTHNSGRFDSRFQLTEFALNYP
ncbi:SprT-like domain-containing protein [Sulfuriroseicoccus oceanibius]|uniref:SprT-like domain-containing protein n=1 Tax=Sulfuriroseicoccus oceanibius TaxID=2707525 RepID=A0A6B3LDD9_9BACT|nr:SprT-like domain-containing protein [Sulfuriroseicoccus oceanibius]QQL44970.1 SprT-like domain-containing protein [Sulfuriroseicoccus oceanibius]